MMSRTSRTDVGKFLWFLLLHALPTVSYCISVTASSFWCCQIESECWPVNPFLGPSFVTGSKALPQVTTEGDCLNSVVSDALYFFCSLHIARLATLALSFHCFHFRFAPSQISRRASHYIIPNSVTRPLLCPLGAWTRTN